MASVGDGTDTFTYGYVADSNLLASVTGPQHTVLYSHETNRDVVTVVDNQVSGSSLSKYVYAYHDLARRTSRQQSG